MYLGTVVPGTRKTYQEVIIYGLRDFIVEKQIPYSKVKWASVVTFIRVI